MRFAQGLDEAGAGSEGPSHILCAGCGLAKLEADGRCPPVKSPCGVSALDVDCEPVRGLVC